MIFTPCRAPCSAAFSNSKAAIHEVSAAEFVGADAGLGYLIQTSMAFSRTPLASGAVVVLAIMGIMLFQAVALAQRLLFPWSRSVEGTNKAVG